MKTAMKALALKRMRAYGKSIKFLGRWKLPRGRVSFHKIFLANPPAM